MKTDQQNPQLLVIKDILPGLGIEQLTPLQAECLTLAHDRRDLLVLSPTGSGKTLAYLLPLLQILAQAPTDRFHSLILVPSRELALQVDRVFSSLKSGFRAVCCYGGHSLQSEKNSLLTGQAQVLIGTPGRILDHMKRGHIDASALKLLIIDEFDKALELGFHEEMADIIGLLPVLERRMFFSATEAEEIPQFAGVGRIKRLDYLQTERELVNRLQLMQVLSPVKDKLETLHRLLCSLGAESSMVFCNHRESVSRVAQYLVGQGFAAVEFHGGLEQDARERALYKFSNGSAFTLVATDLAARGLDIPEVEHIIHYHLPVDEEAFTHRNGRTARWQAKGTSYLILHPEEQIPAYLDAHLPSYRLDEQLAAVPQPEWCTLYIGKGKKDKLHVIDIVGFMHKQGGLSKEQLGKIDVKDHFAYVAVARSQVSSLLTRIRDKKIKGMKTIIEEAY